MYVLQENFVPVSIEYYDNNDRLKLLKTLHQSHIQNVKNIPTAMKMVMYNKSDDTKTSMEFLDIDYHLELDDGLFTERGLKK